MVSHACRMLSICVACLSNQGVGLMEPARQDLGGMANEAMTSVLGSLQVGCHDSPSSCCLRRPPRGLSDTRVMAARGRSKVASWRFLDLWSPWHASLRALTNTRCTLGRQACRTRHLHLPRALLCTLALVILSSSPERQPPLFPSLLSPSLFPRTDLGAMFL